MKPPVTNRFLPLLGLLIVLGGCGASGNSIPENDFGRLTAHFDDAVWYAEVGESTAVAVRSGPVVAEDGTTQTDAISLKELNNGSTYINGVFSVGVPDREPVSFTARVGFTGAAISDQPVVFSVILQDGDQFPALGQVTANLDGKLDQLTIDLSPYRGQNLVLIFSVSAGAEKLPGDLIWVGPSIANLR